jgi:hypothetical protein
MEDQLVPVLADRGSEHEWSFTVQHSANSSSARVCEKASKKPSDLGETSGIGVSP